MKRTKLVNKTEYLFFRLAIWILRLFPYPWGKRIITSLFVFIGYRLGVRRKIAENHIRKVYPDMDVADRDKLLRDVYYNLGLTSAEVYLQKDEDFVSSFSISGRDHVDKAFALGKGVLLATAHLGNWEVARVIPLHSIPLSVVAKQQHNPYFDKYNNAIRTQHGLIIIDSKRGLRGIMQHLKQNGMVALLVDQNAGRTGLVMDFMGFPASHWRGIAKIALRYKVPIVPGFTIRTSEGNIKLCFEPMIYHPELEDIESNYHMILKKIDDHIESYINRYPEQWFWVHKRWKATGAMRNTQAEI